MNFTTPTSSIQDVTTENMIINMIKMMGTSEELYNAPHHTVHHQQEHDHQSTWMKMLY